MEIVRLETDVGSGLKRMTLKVLVNDIIPSASWSASSDAVLAGEGVIHQEIIFLDHFGCQFPFLEQDVLEVQIENRNGSVFLLNCIAGVAAR